MADAAAPYVWGAGGSQVLPEQVTAQQKIAHAMMMQGIDTSPVQHWTQGVSRVAQALLGGYMSKEADDEQKAIRARDRDALLGVLGGSPTAAPAATPAAPIPAPVRAAPAVIGQGGAPSTPDAQGVYGADAVMMPPSGTGAPAGPDYGKAIAGLETGGRADPYAVIGPDNGKGQRPVGKYQVMDFNIGPWTKEILGQEMTPQQFAASPDAQEAVFKGKFGQYVEKYGNPQDAASAWFTGGPLATGANKRDVLGTTGKSYVEMFTKKLGPTGGAVAAAEDPAALPPNATPTSALPPGYVIPGQSASPAAPAVSPGVQTVANAMKPAAAPGPGGIPDNQKADIRRLLSTTPGSPAYNLGMQLVGKAVSKEREEVSPMTAEERQKWQVPENMSAGIDRSTGKPVFSPPQTNIALNTTQKGQEVMATKVAEDFQNVNAAGRDAVKRTGVWDEMERAAKGFTPGATANIKLEAKRYLKDLGVIAGEDVPDAEVFKQMQQQIAIHAQPKGQGAVSNTERELFAKAIPNITMSPEALTRALQMSRKLDDYDRKVAQIYRDSARKNQGVPNGIDVNDEIEKLGSPLSSSDNAFLKTGAAASAPATQSVATPAAGGVRKYNPATGKIE